MYKEKVLITSNDVDNHYCLKVSSIFKLLQMVSTNHSEILHIGKEDVMNNGMIWVVTKMQVNIYEYPHLNDEIMVCTHPGATKKFIYPRFYEIYDKKGKLLIAGAAIWVLLDANSRRLITKPLENKKLVDEPHKDDIALPNSFSIPGECLKIEDRKVRYNDIDLNGHLNNTKYVDYIVDINDKKFYDSYQVKQIVISYEHEIKEGQIVTIYQLKMDNDQYVKGEIEGKTSFSAYLQFNERIN